MCKALHDEDLLRASLVRQATDLRIVLRVVRTVLRCFYRQLRAKAGVFVEALIAGGILLVCCLTCFCHSSLQMMMHGAMRQEAG